METVSLSEFNIMQTGHFSYCINKSVMFCQYYMLLISCDFIPWCITGMADCMMALGFEKMQRGSLQVQGVST